MNPPEVKVLSLPSTRLQIRLKSFRSQSEQKGTLSALLVSALPAIQCLSCEPLTLPVGWSLGCGSVSLAAPNMFQALGENGFYIHAVFNIFAIAIVYCFYPETSCRTLEEVGYQV